MNTRRAEIVLDILIGLGILALIAVVGYPRFREMRYVRVRIGVGKDFGSLLFRIPELDPARSYYRLEKVTPEFVPLTEDPLDGLKRGVYDIAAVPWGDLLLSPLAGADTVKALASVVVQRVHDAIIITKDGPIKTLASLKGKKIGFRPADERLAGLILDQLAEQGLTGVTRVPLTDTETPVALAEKKVDALYVTEPFRSYVLGQGDTALIEGLMVMYVTPNLPDLALACRSDFARRNRLAAVRMKNVIEAAINYLRNRPETVASFMARLQDWPAEGRVVVDMKTPVFQRLADIDVRAVEKYQTLLRERGATVAPIPIRDVIFDRNIFNR